MSRLARELDGLRAWPGWTGERNDDDGYIEPIEERTRPSGRRRDKDQGRQPVGKRARETVKETAKRPAKRRGGAKVEAKVRESIASSITEESIAQLDAQLDSGYITADHTNTESEQDATESEENAIEAIDEDEQTRNEPETVSEKAHSVLRGANNNSGYISGEYAFEDAEAAELAQTLNINLDKIIRDREEANDTITVSNQNESITLAGSQNPESNSNGLDEAKFDRACLAGPRCPLCECPINGTYFIMVQCEVCDRSYHQECVCYGHSEQHHPFYNLRRSRGNWCKGCGCPHGDELGVYVGHPGILHHRRYQDPDFKEYFREGRREEAKWAHTE